MSQVRRCHSDRYDDSCRMMVRVMMSLRASGESDEGAIVEQTKPDPFGRGTLKGGGHQIFYGTTQRMSTRQYTQGFARLENHNLGRSIAPAGSAKSRLLAILRFPFQQTSMDVVASRCFVQPLAMQCSTEGSLPRRIKSNLYSLPSPFLTAADGLNLGRLPSQIFESKLPLWSDGARAHRWPV